MFLSHLKVVILSGDCQGLTSFVRLVPAVAWEMVYLAGLLAFPSFLSLSCDQVPLQGRLDGCCLAALKDPWMMREIPNVIRYPDLVKPNMDAGCGLRTRKLTDSRAIALRTIGRVKGKRFEHSSIMLSKIH